MSTKNNSRESAHVHSVVIDLSQMQLSGGGGIVKSNKPNIAPPLPPKPPESDNKIFSSLILPVTNAPLDIAVDSWNYSSFELNNAFIEIEFVDWVSLSSTEKEDIIDHFPYSNLVIRETDDPKVYNLSIYLLEYVDDSNAYILYDYSTEIMVGKDTKTFYGLPREGGVVPIPIQIRFNSKSPIDSSYRPILSPSNVYNPETGEILYDVSVGFYPREPFPVKVFRDYFTKVLCKSYPILLLRESSDLSYVFPNNGYLPDSVKSDTVQDLSDLVLAVYYSVSNDGYPYYRKSENWSITNREITIPEISNYDSVILVIDPTRAKLSLVTGNLNLMLLDDSGTGDMDNTELGLFGGCIGTGNPFELLGNSYTDLIPRPKTYFIGEHSLIPFLNGFQSQVWSIKEFSYPYIAYVNYNRLPEEDPYPHSDNFLYTSSSPQGFDTQSDIQITAWVSSIPWGSRVLRSQLFTMTTDPLPFDPSPINQSIEVTSIKQASIELSFLQWADEESRNNLLEVFRNCYLSIIRVSETGYVLLMQPNQSLTRESISDNSACVLSIYIDSDMDAPLPEFIDSIYPIETRSTSFTTIVTRMCTNIGSSSSPSTQNIIVKFILDGVENTNPEFHPVVPPHVEGETISFSNELNISFLQ